MLLCASLGAGLRFVSLTTPGLETLRNLWNLMKSEENIWNVMRINEIAASRDRASVSLGAGLRFNSLTALDLEMHGNL